MLEFGSVEDKGKAIKEVSNLALSTSDVNDTQNDNGNNDGNSSVSNEDNEHEESTTRSDNS